MPQEYVSMIAFNYIDRQKSAVGSSEKSQKVHSANWKEEVHLRKELESLKKQESETIGRIFSAQRIVAHQFRRRIFKTIDQINTHEKLKADLKQQKKNNNHVNQNFSKRPDSVRSSTPVQRTETIPDPVNDCNQRLRSFASFRRPVTASETRSRLWERKIKSMTNNLQRAKSAPALRITVSQTVQDLQNRGSKTALSRGSTGINPINREQWNKNRIKEVAKQREAVLKFVKGIEHLQVHDSSNLSSATVKSTSHADPEKT